MSKTSRQIKLSNLEGSSSSVKLIKSQNQTHAHQSKNLASTIIKKHMSKGRLSISIQSSPLLQLMSKDHESLEGGRNIYQYIKDYAFFKILFQNQSDIPEEKLFTLCSRMQLEYYPTGGIIFKEGEKSNNKMYVVATGKVAIVLSKPVTFQEDETMDKQNYNNEPLEEKKNQEKNKLNIDINHQKQLHHHQSIKNQNLVNNNSNSRTSIANLVENINLIIDRYGYKVNEITQGQQFGEKVLFAETAKQQVRSATSIAMENVYVIVLMRDDFIDILKQFKNEQYSKKQLLFQTIPRYDEIASIQVIENILYSFKEQAFGRDKNITREGETYNKIYIVFQGEVAILKNNIILATVGLFHPSILGEEALFNKEGIHEYTSLVISSNAKVLKMSASQFRSKSPLDCVHAIKLIYLQKKQLRDKLFTEISQQQQNNQEQINLANSKEEELQQNDNQLMINFRKEIQKNKERNQILSLMRNCPKKNDFKNENNIKTLIDEGTKTYEDIKSILINNNMIDSLKIPLKSKTQTLKMRMKEVNPSDSPQKYNDLGVFSDEFKRQVRHRLLHYGVLPSPKQPSVLTHESIDYFKQFTKKILKKKEISKKKFLSEASLITSSIHQSQDLPLRQAKLNQLAELKITNQLDQENSDLDEKVFVKKRFLTSRNNNESPNIFFDNKSDPQIQTSRPYNNNQISSSMTFKQLFKQYRNETMIQKSQFLEKQLKLEILNSYRLNIPRINTPIINSERKDSQKYLK